MKQTDIISRRALIRHLYANFDAEFIHGDKVVDVINSEPSIDQSEAVKIIWAAQIDDLVERIKTLAWKDSSVGVDDVIEILEGAK